MNVNIVHLFLKEIGNYRFTFHPFMRVKKTYKCEASTSKLQIHISYVHEGKNQM